MRGLHKVAPGSPCMDHGDNPGLMHPCSPQRAGFGNTVSFNGAFYTYTQIHLFAYFISIEIDRTLLIPKEILVPGCIAIE